MPTVQHAQKQLFLKVVYYGSGLCGKTTNLQYLHAVTKPDLRGRLISVDTAEDRTLFFDLMPLDLGLFKGYSVRLHLCTVPGQAAYDNTRRMILRGVDGVVFVADSQREMQLSNYRSMVNLRANLYRQNIDPSQLPTVIQYNKRDLPNVLSIDEMRRGLGVLGEVTEVEASASVGYGVSATLKAILKNVLALVSDPRELPEGRSPSIVPAVRASSMPGAAPPAAGLHTRPVTCGSFVFPKPAELPKFSDAAQEVPLAKVS